MLDVVGYPSWYVKSVLEQVLLYAELARSAGSLFSCGARLRFRFVTVGSGKGLVVQHEV